MSKIDMQDRVTEAAPQKEINPLSKALVTAAGQIEVARSSRDGGRFLSPGDVADLRRMDLNATCAAYWRLMAKFVVGKDLPKIVERRWALAFRGMAVMAPHVHDGQKSPGAALAELGYSSENRPLRLNRLLRAEDETFEDLFLTACRYLSAKAVAINWASMGRLALIQDDNSRKAMARDFYYELGRSSRP